MIRWRNGSPIVEVYDKKTRKKVHVKPSQFGVSFDGLSGRALERAAIKLDLLAYEAYKDGSARPETCDSFAKRWADDFPRSESSNVTHRERVKKFGEDFRGRELKSITRTEAREWAKNNKSRAAFIRTMLYDAVREGLIPENPFANLGQRKARGRRDIIPLTRAELEALIGIARDERGEEFAAMICWAAYTCMRPGEVFDARWSRLEGDVYQLRSQFNSRVQKVTEPKHQSFGAILVPEPALLAMQALPRRLGDDLMFRTIAGQQYRSESLNFAWRTVRSTFVATLPETHHLKGREKPLAFYELRHFGASYMLNVLELQSWVVAKQLRHSDGGKLVETLYGHPSDQAAMNMMRRAFKSKVTPLKSGDDLSEAAEA